MISPRHILPLFAALFVYACTSSAGVHDEQESSRYFSVEKRGESTVIRTCSPFGPYCDSLVLTAPVQKVVCMSTTLLAAFDQVGAVDCVKGVSGKNYVSNPAVYANPEVAEVGYESAMDYETIVGLAPDVVLAYSVSSVEAPYVTRLRSLGVPVLVVYDNFESHPLARAEYIRLCGAMTGNEAAADSVFAAICKSYHETMSVASRNSGVTKVMINAPYGDAWYVPAKGSYMHHLISDAGGELLGSVDGLESSMITLETAYGFSRAADVWLNPGYADSRAALMSLHPSFSEFCRDGLRIYNNTLRMNPEGGNDFYESGAMRPDLVLKDLVAIFSGSPSGLEYHIEVK